MFLVLGWVGGGVVWAAGGGGGSASVDTHVSAPDEWVVGVRPRCHKFPAMLPGSCGKSATECGACENVPFCVRTARGQG